MATILHLETATTNCSVSIATNGKLVSLKEFNSASFSHAEQLHSFIEEALVKASFSFSDLDAIAVSKGPGSYTGLRIGVSAAKGLCFALDVPLIAVATLSSLAQQLTVADDEIIIPVLDARRMEVYSSVYDATYNVLIETKAQIIDTDSFLEFAGKKHVHIIGSGAEKCEQLLNYENFTYYKEAIPSAKEMVSVAFEKFKASQFEDVAYFEPFYLKDFMLPVKKAKK